MSNRVVLPVEKLVVLSQHGLLSEQQIQEVFHLSPLVYRDANQAILDAGGRTALSPSVALGWFPQGPVLSVTQVKQIDRDQGLEATIRDLGRGLSVLEELQPAHNALILVEAIA